MKYVPLGSSCPPAPYRAVQPHVWKILHWVYAQHSYSINGIEVVFFCERCLARHKQTEDYE